MHEYPKMTTSYISCGCNCAPHSADWGRNGLICYGACNAIAIYDPCAGKIGKVLQTLHHHTGRVNTVRWIRSGSAKAEVELLSGCTDGTAIIWSKVDNNFKPTTIINATAILTITNSLHLSSGTINDTSFTKLLICTSTINGDFKLWLRASNREIKCLQEINFGNKLPIECSLSQLPSSKAVLLAIATEDTSIQLFCQNSLIIEESNFIKVKVLTGHEDWVRCMDFSTDLDGNILLASGSQDTMIRLWKISEHIEKFAEEKLEQKKNIFALNNTKYNVTLESVLSGHKGWIYGVQWYSLKQKDKNVGQSVKLLSCSLDKSMIVWELNNLTEIQSKTVRVGEVGGDSLGFYGCKFGPLGTNILAHGYQGSFRIWEYSSLINHWIPSPALSGHFAEVVDLCWDSKGRFIITASKDQTTRIHGSWKHGEEEIWHEIGRPQVHGYDMSCLAMLTPYMFASGAEEKVVRIFTAPEIFRNQLSKIANADDFEYTKAESATVPALGLTNKATFDGEIKIKETKTNYSKHEEYLPLTEETLIQNTLWPELQKLYGHGYEIFSMAARHDGSLLATACKSTGPEHSAIILWNTATWSSVQKLISHQLTITQMAFSPNDKFLISVSRDRRWSLFEWKDNAYTVCVVSTKKDSLHSRIIWCCAWSHDSMYFATGSRDGKIGIWNTIADNTKNIIPITYLDVKNCSVTALAFASLSIAECSYILAVGYDCGCIEIYKLTMTAENRIWEILLTYDSSQAHHLTVNRLMFRPQTKDSCNILQLASCASDHTVKIYDINVLSI